MFFIKLTDMIVGYDDIMKMCGNDSPFIWSSGFGYPTLEKEKPEHEKCRKERNAKLAEARTRTMQILLAIGFAGIVIGIIMQRSKSGNIAGKGIAAGGVLTIIYQLLYSWYDISENMRVLLTGTLLASLLAGTYYMF